MKSKCIYLDNASTKKIYPEVIKVMQNHMLNIDGNPGSVHKLGEEARNALDSARKSIADNIRAKAWEIIFTSGATESNNLALKGLAERYNDRKKIIISSIEHSSIYECCQELKNKGYDIIEVPVNEKGYLNISYLENIMDKNTLLVSVIYGNNEFGTIQDIGRIGKICRDRRVFFHTDAVQSLGNEKIDVMAMNIDLLSASAHKLGGPKGIGFLYLREGIDIIPIIQGGGQEKGRRSGTENVAGAVGFAKALEISVGINKKKVIELREYFIKKLENMNGKINGSRENRLFNNVNVSFPGLKAENLLIVLSERGVMCSTRSACSEKGKKYNRILSAIGLDEKDINGTLRFSLSEYTKRKDIDYTLSIISDYLIINKNF
ncbi:cysteine desulfurase [Candidatus Pacearchaeota archaeon]|nr:cysteine desulfurase [Candidatus Pacearchaeota archaeon]